MNSTITVNRKTIKGMVVVTRDTKFINEVFPNVDEYQDKIDTDTFRRILKMVLVNSGTSYSFILRDNESDLYICVRAIPHGTMSDEDIDYLVDEVLSVYASI